ncbi:unnamed protein product, partial [Meganyctiphanes norvegica]
GGLAAQECGFPGSPSHSTVNLSDDGNMGSIATYSCERGFELLGPARRECGANGTWTPPGIPFCVLNVAAGKAPLQSSVREGGIPQKAVDGSTAEGFSPSTCSSTNQEPNPWWYVNLLEPYMVQLVRLDFGLECCGDLPATITVRVGNNRPDLGANPICNRFTGILEAGRPLYLPCGPPLPGAFVSVHLDGPQDRPAVQLSICEALVYTDQALPLERCPSFRDQQLGSIAAYNGKCYLFHNTQPDSFDSALEFCRARGGSLVDETSPALQGFLSWELWRRHRDEPSGQYWMGAVRDPEDPLNWRWINGRDVEIAFWNLPGGNDNCARFDGTKGWLWSDTNCNAKINYICQYLPETCGHPEQPPNSFMSLTNNSIGSVVEYSCLPGYVLVGPNTRTCLNSGFYDKFPPTCRYVECGPPAAIENGKYMLINGTRQFLSNVQYNCDEGYTLVGRGDLVCDVDERWDGPPPTCQMDEAIKPELTDLAVESEEIENEEENKEEKEESEEKSEEKSIEVEGELEVIVEEILKEPVIDKEGELKVIEEEVLEDIVIEEVEVKSTEEVEVKSTEKPLEKTTDVELIPPYIVNNDLNDDKLETPAVIEAIVPVPQDEVETNINAINNINSNRGLGVDGPGYTLKDETRRVNEKLHIGAVIALGVFGAFVLLAAIVTTLVMLLKRGKKTSSQAYIRRDNEDSLSSGSSNSDRGHGLNKYYKRAWDDLQHTAGGDLSKPSKKHQPLARTVTLDHPTAHGGHPKISRTETLDNPGFRSHRSIGTTITVNDLSTVYVPPEHAYGKHTGRKDRHQRNERDWRKY